jgi:hypothetical protein
MSSKKWEKQEVFQNNFHFWDYSLCTVISLFTAEAYTDCRGGQRPVGTILHTSGSAPLKRDE